MKQGSFEEHLNNAAEEFALQPKTGVWQNIEAALEPEKSRKALPLLWTLSGALIYVVAILMNPVHTLVTPQLHEVVAEDAGEIHAPQKLENIPVSPDLEKDRQGAKPSFETKGRQVRIASKDAHVSRIYTKTDVVTNDGLQSALPAFSPQVGPPVILNNNEPEAIALTTGTFAGSSSEQDAKANDSLVADQVKTADTTRSMVGIAIRTSLPARYYAGLTYAPGWSSAKVHLTQPGGQSIVDYFNRKETDRPAGTYTFGITGGYEKGRHRLETGLQYSYAGYRVRIRNVEAPVVTTFTSANSLRMNANDSFRLTGSGEDGTYFHTSFRFITIPVGYSYVVWERSKWHISMDAQFSYNRMVASDALMYDREKGYYVLKNMADNSSLRKNIFVLSGGPEFSYRLMPGLELSVRPQIGHTLNPVEKGTLSNGLQFMNVAFGMRWKFN